MDTGTLVYAYAAAAAVAALAVAVFSPSINRVLKTLVPAEIETSWSLFIKFALFVFSFTGGMPIVDQGHFIDRNGPAVIPPVEGMNVQLVMRAVGGALIGASWILLVFFGVTLTAHMTARVWVA